jgi:hypothetical protein
MNNTYLNFINYLLENNDGLKKIYSFLPKFKGKHIVTFCHDDPDGVTSGILFKRLTDKLGIKNTLFFPYKFPLSKQEVENVKTSLSDTEVLFIIDKGTIDEYNDFIKFYPEVVVIDHHPKIGTKFDNITVFNPALQTYVRTSGSFLVHIISTLFNNTNMYDDFICLIGMKCDWAIDPLNNDIPEFVSTFYNDRILPRFSWLVEKNYSLRPTMFDIKNKDFSCLLNQIGELFFAITGGGFQYFYNSYNEKLKNIDQPKFCFENFVNEIKIEKVTNIDEFIDTLPNKEIIRIIYNYFLSDWTTAEQQFDNQTFLAKQIDNIKIFFFFGKNIKLMPMVGSKKLYEYAKGNDAAIIMYNFENEDSLHISFRGTTDKIHLGKIASSLADKSNVYFGENTSSGGGHPLAAECKIKTKNLDFLFIIKELISLLEQYKWK